MILRDYQARTVDAFRDALNKGMMTPCCSVATGGGKSLILNTFAKHCIAKGHRVLVMTHVKELITQLSETATKINQPHGINAASLKRRDTSQQMVIAQIQSVYKDIYSLGAFSVCFIDEAHLISPSGEGMYRQALDGLRSMNPKLRLIGLSATPFRMGTGLIYGKGKMFEECVERVTMRELINAGYLTPLVGRNADTTLDTRHLSLRGGDFIASELADFMEDEAKVERAVADLTSRASERNRVLLFSSSNKHSGMIVDALIARNMTAEAINGTMVDTQRDDILARHRAGAFKFLVNCAVLTTGYDDPQIDCVALLRPSRSPGLVLQMVGRGLRKHDTKQDCLILDYGGILEALGPLDLIEERIAQVKDAKKIAGECPMKTCPKCSNVVPTGQRACSCGYEWPKELNQEIEASTAMLLSGSREWLIQRVVYSINQGKDNKPPCVRVEYWSDAAHKLCCEYLSIDANADPYARKRAREWVRGAKAKESGNRTITVENSEIVGTINGKRDVVDSAIKFLAYMTCFEKPESIVIAPNPTRPKYPLVTHRRFV